MNSNQASGIMNFSIINRTLIKFYEPFMSYKSRENFLILNKNKRSTTKQNEQEDLHVCLGLALGG